MISIIFTVIAALIALGAFWFMGAYNSLVRLKAMVDEAWSGIDVQLKRRYDLIPNLVATVKQYASHEKGVFEEVTRARSVSMHATTVEQKADAERGLASALKTLFAVAENYPTLKANENFMALQRELSLLESEIQLSRRYYNGTARNYNIKVMSFPSSLVAHMSGFEKAPYFELDNPEERQAPKVSF